MHDVCEKKGGEIKIAELTSKLTCLAHKHSTYLIGLCAAAVPTRSIAPAEAFCATPETSLACRNSWIMEFCSPINFNRLRISVSHIDASARRNAIARVDTQLRKE